MRPNLGRPRAVPDPKLRDRIPFAQGDAAMATDIRKTPGQLDAPCEPASSHRAAGLWALLGAAFLAGVAVALRVFSWGRARSESAPVLTVVPKVPVVHEPVTLTPEGAEILRQVMDPSCPIGKPVHHRRRRLTSGDAAS